MKYKLLRYTLLSMLVMFFGGLAFADEVTMKYSGDTTGNMTGENDAATFGLDAEAWSVVGAKGGSSNFPGLNKTGDFRLYYSDQGGSTITVSSLNGATINSIKMTFTSDTYSNVSVTVDDKAVEATDGVHSINSGSFVLGNANTTNVQVRIKEVVIDYTPVGGQSDTRTATTVTLDEHATTLSVGETMNLSAVVKAGDNVLDAAVSWKSSDENVASITEGGIVTALAAGSTTIKASYAGDANNKESSTSFTLTVKDIKAYTSIADMLESYNTTQDIKYIFTGLAVTYVNGSYTYVHKSGDGDILLYGSNLGLEADAVYDGYITGQLKSYNGLPEIAVSASDIHVTKTEGMVMVDIAIITPDLLSRYINKMCAIEHAEFVSANNKNYTFKVGETELIAYNNFGLNTDNLTAGKKYTIEGFGAIYTKNESTTYQIYPSNFREEQETPAEQWTYRDFAVNLTNAEAIPTTSNSFGVKVAEDGTYTAVAADDATANFTVKSARFNDAQHGWVNCEFTIPVTGPVLIKLGDCQYGAQTGKITDAEGNITELTKPAKQCWAASKPDENVVATYYRGLNATTLTVKYDGYCPFISVTAIDPNNLPAEVTKHTVTFAAGEATGEVPAAIEDEVGAKITLPTNYTLYVEGKTLTAWSDGENTFAPGVEYTIPEADATLTAVFTANEVSLADRTEPVTVKWNFRRDQGAPAVGWEGKDGLVWVAQATVNGKAIDVALPFSTAPGKFNNKSNTDWVQINNGTKFTVPSCKGATISMEAYNEITTTTIDGQTDYTQGKTISYEIAGAAENVDVVIGDGSYYRYIQVVLPVVQSQGGGESYENATAKVNWPFSDSGAIDAYVAEPEGVFSTVAVNTGDLTITGVGSRTGDNLANGISFIKLKPAGSTTAMQWVAKPAAGLTFTPTRVNMWIQRFGTDAENGVTITAKVGDGEAITLGNFTAPRANHDKAKDKYGSNSNWTNHVEIELTADQQAALTSGEELTLSATIGVGNTKEGGFSDVIIEGLINGTAAQVEKYALATAVSPEEAGSVTKYPNSDEYEAGSEVTLTATENFGYDFVNWTNAAGEKVSTEAKFKYTVNSNDTLTANFQAVETYELALTVDGTNDYMVTVNPAPTVVDGKNMYEAGTAVQLTANQYEGLVTFTNWSDGETSASKLISMTENTQITAMYAQADIIAGWDFYTAGGNGRKADFFAQDNDADALNLVKTEDGSTSGWLDKSTLGGGGYESFKGAAVNWRTGASNGDVGNYHWQTKVNAEAFTDINVQFQMLYNYNAYQTYNVEFSTNGTEWTKAGSISMSGAKAPASFNNKLPEAANNQKELYIRMIADKNSKVDGAASANDGNTLAMFFITGTPKLVNDGKAPVLVSTVPADNATGVSATGKVVLTFDERVKVAANTKAIIGNQELVPIVSGKTVTFEYKGLEYATPYTFTLPANTIGDLTDNMKAEAITLNFTTMERPAIQKGSYDAVVENVEQLMAAITKAEARSDKNVRFRIFIKNGNYTIPLSSTMKTVNGYEVPECITFINSGKISFIGESRDSVIITNGIEKTATFAGTYGTTSKYDGIGNSDVFQIKGSDYYFQDLTIESGMEDATGRDLAVQDKATRTIYKNTGLRGYQDTWTSNNDNGLYYFEGGYLRGRTDYMCGKGDAFFNGVELRQIAGGYAAVPSKSIKYGYVYKDCVINGEPAVVKYDTGEKRSAKDVDGNYTLGRPWGSGTPIALYIDTKMNVVPSAIGWNEMSNGWPKRFAEYNSMTSTGSVIDLSGRKKIFGDNHANNPVLTAEEALEAGNLHNMFGEWDPTLATEQAPVPANVKLTGNTLTWDNSNYALLWAIVKNNKVVDFTTEPTFTIDDATATWAVRAANEMGGLSEAVQANATNGIESISNAEQLTKANSNIYNMQGIRVNKAQKGLYIINGKKVVVK